VHGSVLGRTCPSRGDPARTARNTESGPDHRPRPAAGALRGRGGPRRLRASGGRTVRSPSAARRSPVRVGSIRGAVDRLAAPAASRRHLARRCCGPGPQRAVELGAARWTVRDRARPVRCTRTPGGQPRAPRRSALVEIRAPRPPTYGRPAPASARHDPSEWPAPRTGEPPARRADRRGRSAGPGLGRHGPRWPPPRRRGHGPNDRPTAGRRRRRVTRPRPSCAAQRQGRSGSPGRPGRTGGRLPAGSRPAPDRRRLPPTRPWCAG